MGPRAILTPNAAPATPDQQAMQALVMIGLHYVQEQMCRTAMGANPDPALLAMLRGGGAGA
eukprot:15451738-Alexandrium_andersonii.AAC.1